MTRIGILSVFVVVFCHALVFAHGGKTHVAGTVTALDAQHVVVKTREGKIISIRLSTETKYRKGEAAATGADLADLKVGDQVVVEAAGGGNTLTTSEIRFSSAGEEKGHERTTHSPATP